MKKLEVLVAAGMIERKLTSKIAPLINSDLVGKIHLVRREYYEGDKIVTAGGRVFGVTALADNLNNAIYNAYSSLSTIHFKGMYYRKDIGKKGLA